MALRDLAGRSWNDMPADLENESLQSYPASPFAGGRSDEVTPNSSRSHSPRPVTPSADDVMKLPRKDMHIFGLCPVQDDFVLVVCDYCNSSVKMEAFASHVKLRHGIRAANVKSQIDKVEKNLRKFDLPKEEQSSGSTSGRSSPILPAPPVPVKEPDIEPMDVDEADSTVTSSNVISIPDTEPLPHNMSGDLMTLMGESADSTTPSVSSGPAETINLTLASPLGTPDIHTVKKPNPGSGKKGKVEGRKLVREYNPDKHCGVWDEELKRHCTRALTCKSHSVLLKRKIQGRSKTFDELVAAHKKSQNPIPPPVTPTVSVVVSGTATAPLPGLPVPSSPVIPQQQTIIHPNIQINVPQSPQRPLRKPKDGGADENLHYTTDHPKPLAVCTFGGRRIGGLLIADRSQFLTRKLVRVAITSQGGIARVGLGNMGFHRIKPRMAQGSLALSDQQIGLIKGGGVIKRTQSGVGGLVRALQPPTINYDSGNYLVNYNSLSVKRAVGVGSNPTISPSLSPGVQGVPMQVLPASESFKTDIQDFKGGLKFERGRKIKHILPGNEVTK